MDVWAVVIGLLGAAAGGMTITAWFAGARITELEESRSYWREETHRLEALLEGLGVEYLPRPKRTEDYAEIREAQSETARRLRRVMEGLA